MGFRGDLFPFKPARGFVQQVDASKRPGSPAATTGKDASRP